MWTNVVNAPAERDASCCRTLAARGLGRTGEARTTAPEWFGTLEEPRSQAPPLSVVATGRRGATAVILFARVLGASTRRHQ
jgi:hypothetical protein